MTGSVDRTRRSNLSGTRVRDIGMSNETVTRLSARNAVSPSASGDAPGGIESVGAPAAAGAATATGATTGAGATSRTSCGTLATVSTAAEATDATLSALAT